jgi:hypothetical protein
LFDVLRGQGVEKTPSPERKGLGKDQNGRQKRCCSSAS